MYRLNKRKLLPLYMYGYECNLFLTYGITSMKNRETCGNVNFIENS